MRAKWHVQGIRAKAAHGVNENWHGSEQKPQPRQSSRGCHIPRGSKYQYLYPEESEFLFRLFCLEPNTPCLRPWTLWDIEGLLLNPSSTKTSIANAQNALMLVCCWSLTWDFKPDKTSLHRVQQRTHPDNSARHYYSKPCYMFH